MDNGFNLEATDPEQFQEIMSPIVGPFRARPVSGSKFVARVSPRPLKKLGLFTVAANSIKIDIEPPLEFFGINLALGKPFSITDGKQCHQFFDDVHLVAPYRPMKLEAASDCRVLAVCIHFDGLLNYVAKLNLSDWLPESRMRNRLALSDPLRFPLVRSLARLWSEIQLNMAGPGPEILIAEMEDEVMTNFVLTARNESDDRNRLTTPVAPQSIAQAEDYLCAHIKQAVSRADLAEISNVSIRTLSRGFMKRHGLGPMQFLKSRRMDAAYCDLLGAEPDSTTVTEIAGRYGFTHLGKFAVEYKQAFRESPSATLRH